MPEWVSVVLLGIIEGVTEFLPISSTGHLLLAEQWLPYRQSDAFLVVIQSAAMIAVLMLFKDRVTTLARGWRAGASRDYLLKLGAAFLVTAAGGLALKLLGFELPETAMPVALALLAGGVLFIVLERWLKGRPHTATITWQLAVVIGVAQLVAAVFPGTSRSGATILAALAFGLTREVAIEFSFLLGVPTMLMAGALTLVSALGDQAGQQLDWGALALGSVVSAVTAFIAVRWLLRYVRSHTFESFGWYRIVLGVVVLALALAR